MMTEQRRKELEAKAEQVKLACVEYFKRIGKHANCVRIGYMVYLDSEDIRASNEIRAEMKAGNIASCDGKPCKFYFVFKRKAFRWSPVPVFATSNATTEELAQKYGYSGARV